MNQYLSRILFSILFSSIIGYERELNDKPAGIRDTILVCLGATIFTVISSILMQTPSVYGNNRFDFGRIIAYTIAGVGFLGSGVIMQRKEDIEGITTASVLWTIVGVGILCGLGQISLAFITTLLIFLILQFKYIKMKYINKEKKK